MNIPYVALKNLKRKLMRTWLLFSIVAIVSCTLFAATLFLKSINNALKIGTYRLGADLIVVPEQAETEAKAAILSGEPTQFLMEDYNLDVVKTIPGVKKATAQLFVKPTSFTCCYNVDVFVVAFDPETDFTVKPWLEKNLKRKLGINEIIAGRNIPVVVGDKLPFFGTTFTVAGTMEPTGMDFFDRAVFMSLGAAYKMAETSKIKSPQPLDISRNKISAVLVQVDNDISPDRVALRIDHDIRGVKSIVSDRIISTVRKQLTGLINAIFIISIILWFIVLLIMGFAFDMIVNERRREIGLLRAMGANRGHIAAIILAEATLLSTAGGAVGIVLGYGLLFSFKGLMLHYLKLPYLFPSLPALVALTGGAFIFSILTGLVAAFLPSITTLWSDPYHAIRSSE